MAADAGDWQIEPAHPTPAGPLIPDAVVLLASGRFAFVELDRGTMSYARVLAKLERYATYRTAPPSGRSNAARAPRSHWQEHYAGPDLQRLFPPLLVVFAPAPRPAASAPRVTAPTPARESARFEKTARRTAPRVDPSLPNGTNGGRDEDRERAVVGA